MSDFPSIILEYEQRGSELSFRLLAPDGEADLGVTHLTEPTIDTIFGKGFELMRDYMRTNLRKRFGLEHVQPGDIYVTPKNGTSAQKFADFGICIGYKPQETVDAARVLEEIESARECSTPYLEFTKPGIKAINRKRAEEAEFARTLDAYFVAERNSFSDGVFREEVGSLLASGRRITTREIKSCAARIAQRENNHLRAKPISPKVLRYFVEEEIAKRRW